jgi:hypothetical protein
MRHLALAAGQAVVLAAILSAGCVGADPALGPPTDGGAEAQADAGDGGIEDGARTDAGDAGDVDAGYQPTSLAGLALWLDAEKGVAVDGAANVTTWTDRSPAALAAQPPTQVAKPMFVPRSGATPASVRFNGSSNYLRLEDHSALRWGTGDFLLEVVARHTKGTAERAGLFNKATATGTPVNFGLHANSQLSGADGKLEGYVVIANAIVSPTGGYQNGLTFLVALERRNGVLALRVGGAEVTSSNDAIQAENVDAVNAPVFVGAMIDVAGSGAMSFLQGDIAEIVAVKGPLAPEKRTELEAYLRGKHALP